MTRIFYRLFLWMMNPMSGWDIRLVFTLLPRDSTLQYKSCVHLWNNFPCIKPLHTHRFLSIIHIRVGTLRQLQLGLLIVFKKGMKKLSFYVSFFVSSKDDRFIFRKKTMIFEKKYLGWILKIGKQSFLYFYLFLIWVLWQLTSNFFFRKISLWMLL